MINKSDEQEGFCVNTNTSQIIIETMVRKAIEDMKESPKRSVRNLVDLALTFSDGRFQQRFFSAAQTMLKNENSPYYELVQNTISHVDTEHLVRFGINLGYNSCTQGAKTIRKIKDKQGFHVPWMLTLHLDTAGWQTRVKRYQNIIGQGEELGICTWQLFADRHPECALSLAEVHPNSAFIVYCSHSEVTEQFLDAACELDNLMLAVRYDEDAASFCGMLREKRMLYSVYYPYSAENTVPILSDDLFYAIEELSPIFAVLVPAANCPMETQTAVAAHIRKLREEQRFPMLPWEVISDCILVDGIISGDGSVMAFDAEGYLHSGNEKTGLNCFTEDLKDLFRNNKKCTTP